jgi:hypothetical protein
MYPTKEKILKTKPIINQKTIEITKTWKKLALPNWKKDINWTKYHKLEMLIITLSETNNKEPPTITADTSYFYNPNNKTIHIDLNNTSIISSLHELAHHLYGPSELKACRWSIWLFITCFPLLYKKLKWSNHLLIKQ